MNTNLRKRKPISYYEPEEPSFDEYVYCEDCADFVYEYCSIHGPLLVIPDDKVPTDTSLQVFVPRAALTIPRVFIHIASSIIPGAGLGVFSTLTLPRGVRFGPYRGICTDEINSMYCWQLYDDNRKPCGVVDGQNPNTSNWMRFVNCARHWREQNLLAYQYRGHIYYRTIKIIPRFTELLVFYGSEYANILHIDLRKYNVPEQYANIINESSKISDVLKTNSNINDSKKQKKVAEDIFLYKTTHNNENITRDTTIERNELNDAINDDTAVEPNCFNEINDSCNDDTTMNSAADNEITDSFKDDTDVETICFNEVDTYNENTAIQSVYYDEINDTSNDVTAMNSDCYKDINDSSYNTAKESNCNNQLIVDYDLKKESFTVTLNQSTPKISDVPHNIIKGFDCDICGKRLSRKSNLNNHKRLHLDVKRLDFNQSEPTNSDVSQSKIEDFYCDICGKRLSCKRNVNRHKRIHLDGKRLEFNQSEPTNSDVPQNIIKDFDCDVCGKRFSTKKNLNRHKLIHINVKRFSCDYCEYKTNIRSTFYDHISAIHTKSTEYKCSICPYVSYNRSYLRRHSNMHRKKDML